MAAERSAARERWDLSFPPETAKGMGRGRTYKYSAEQFRELYEKAKGLSGADRKALLSAYDIGWPALRSRAGVEPDAPRARKGGGDEAPRQRTSSLKSREELVAGLRGRADALKAELDAVEKQLATLEGLDDDQYRTLAEMMSG